MQNVQGKMLLNGNPGTLFFRAKYVAYGAFDTAL